MRNFLVFLAKKRIDYFPFGMLLPGRHANTSDYRYGFQGQELDNEIKGEGNSINYKYRMHDPRVGRFFAVDPLTAEYPHYTPYSFSGNKVIAFRELEGLEEAKFDIMIDHRTAIKLAGEDATSEQVMEIYNEIHFAAAKGINVALFKAPFPENGAARDLIHHYAYGKGETLTLDRRQIKEIYPIFDPDQVPLDLSLTIVDFLSARGLKVGESKNFTKKTLAYAGVPGTLGHTWVTVEGTITRNAETNNLQFKGSVIFDDIFDFDPSDHRGWVAEAQTTIGRILLMGEGFDVVGSLDVTQQYGDVLRDEYGIDPKTIRKPDHGVEYSEGKGVASDAGAVIKE